jgi:thymidine kinase
MKAGKVELYIGGMCAGKTSMMINKVERYFIAGKKCIIIKHSDDTRYDHLAEKNGIVTNNYVEHTKIKVVSTNQLSLLDMLVSEYDIIGVSELQFYVDPTHVDTWANIGKVVICDGLDGDSKRKNFGALHEVIPLCEKVVKLKAVCSCGASASFTKKKTNSDVQKEIGGLDLYAPVCRTCYHLK